MDLDETVKTVIKASATQIGLPSGYIEEIDAEEAEEHQHLIDASTINMEITKVDGETRTRFASEDMGKLELTGEQFALVRVAESGRNFKLTHGAMDMFQIAAILKGGNDDEDNDTNQV